jgi:hypothetical protein
VLHAKAVPVMATYTVTEIRNQRPWPSQEDLQVVYYDFLVEGEERIVNVGRKPTNPLTVGTVLEGTLEAAGGARGGLKFVKSQNGFGGGGGGGGGRGGKSPEESARITQMHSQDMALRYAELQHTRGALPETFNLEQLLVIAGKFTADAKAAKP